MNGPDFWSWLFSEKGQIALAGAAGGVVRWLSLREKWTDGLVAVVVGGICAVYAGPLAINLMEPVVGKVVLDTAARSTLSGFLIGIGGIGFTGFVLDVWRARRAQLNGKGTPE